MLYVPRFRAVLLTFLVFATSLSASVCDLTCSLPAACSRCCSLGLEMPRQANMVMSSDMPMSGTAISGMQMSGMKMASVSVQANGAMAGESSTNVRMPHSISLSSCATETCRQTWDSSSLPALSTQLLPHHAANIQFSTPFKLLIDLHRSGKDLPASQSLASDRLTSSLRI